MKKAVIAIVPTSALAETLASRLKDAGFLSSDISVLVPDGRNAMGLVYEKRTKAPEGTVAGAGAGGLLGGALGLLAGVGALAIPGLGPFIAAGPIMGALSGVAAGATVGGVAGALVGMGIPEYEAKMYEDKLRVGNVLISVHTEDAEQQRLAAGIFKSYGARDISTQSEVNARRGVGASRP